LKIATYQGSKEFRLITLEDCMAQNYYDTGMIDIAHDCTPVLTIPTIMTYITPEGRFGKMYFRDTENCWNTGGFDGISIAFGYVTFWNNSEVNF